MPSGVLLAPPILAPSAIRLAILVALWRAAVRAHAPPYHKMFVFNADRPAFLSPRSRESTKKTREGGGCNFSLAHANSSFSLDPFHFFTARLITRGDRLRVRWAGAMGL